MTWKDECAICRGHGKVVYDFPMFRPPKVGERFTVMCPACGGRGWELRDDNDPRLTYGNG